MPRPRICPLCKKEVSKEDSFEYKNKYYHEKCFNKFTKQESKQKIKEKKEQQQAEKAKKNIQKDTHVSIESNISDKEILAKEEVIDYLKELLKVKKLSPKTYKLLKDYYTSYNFSYKGMLTALKYFYDIKENAIVSDCVGIIPYIYDEAQRYEELKARVVEETETLNTKEIVKEKLVKINKPNNKLIDKLIDIEDLR